MTYQECLSYMYAQLPMYHRVGSVAFKKDLTNIVDLCNHLGNPQERLKCIHVAGTNGKGTVSHLLAFALQQQGFRVGLYTSPHYLDFRERIKINGKYITQKYVVNFIRTHKAIIEKIQPSFFEITVAMAFDYFANQKTDYCVIEVGLGGRLDSTNIITPLMSVITNISFDHTDMLGDTLAAIAGEKAGIIKPSVPVVIGERQVETDMVFREVSQRNQAPMFYAEDLATIEACEKNHLKLRLKNGEQYTFSTELNAPYQLKNLVTAAGALNRLQTLVPLSLDIVFSQMDHFASSVKYMGRWQTLETQPLIIADSAHNEGGLHYVFEKLKNMEYARLHIVMGMVNDKKTHLVLPLFPKNAQYYFAKANIPRGKDAKLLKEEAAGYGLSGLAYTSTRKALAAARSKAKKEDLILVTGSIFTVAEVLPRP